MSGRNQKLLNTKFDDEISLISWPVYYQQTEVYSRISLSINSITACNSSKQKKKANKFFLWEILKSGAGGDGNLKIFYAALDKYLYSWHHSQLSWCLDESRLCGKKVKLRWHISHGGASVNFIIVPGQWTRSLHSSPYNCELGFKKSTLDDSTAGASLQRCEYQKFHQCDIPGDLAPRRKFWCLLRKTSVENFRSTTLLDRIWHLFTV